MALIQVSLDDLKGPQKANTHQLQVIPQVDLTLPRVYLLGDRTQKTPLQAPRVVCSVCPLVSLKDSSCCSSSSYENQPWFGSSTTNWDQSPLITSSNPHYFYISLSIYIEREIYIYIYPCFGSGFSLTHKQNHWESRDEFCSLKKRILVLF